ncbi:GNAT family N-acetyltransferase [Hymenobacter chitinivorans]|uniref:Acetyltransferase (GNAT) family protein n=1 Tax=Hymenobacter chitinivorans DSM 11115 TaxID=1121954 RepID=A0A2M9B9K8_9BACT|nr:GNAT family N-acetyltransferase [Hymenobacter chitinivorans]PJJ54617.1 acetyltransferase (GNAT) family protein [Hymenobacter chitinivorans DSM 11115]
MSSPLRITVAKRTPAVAAQLAELGRQTFHDTFAADNSAADMAEFLATTFSADKQLVELNDPQTTFLLAHHQQDAVGYAKLRLDSTLGLEAGKDAAGRLEIERLYVRQDWIGTGLGASLMRRAIEEARQHKCRTVVLGVWERNEHAIAFYRRFGFKEIGKHEFRVGQDIQTDLILRKGL